jgi:mono/diheme cytochrome c family protein
MRGLHYVVLCLLALALGVLGAGCLDGSETTATPETVQGTLPQATTPSAADLPALKLTGDPAAGKKVFTSAGCVGCHTLADAGATGTVGPNLDEAKPSKELVVQRVTNGQGAMPPFKGQLSDQQIADVAAYVVQATGGG